MHNLSLCAKKRVNRQFQIEVLYFSGHKISPHELIGVRAKRRANNISVSETQENRM